MVHDTPLARLLLARSRLPLETLQAELAAARAERADGSTLAQRLVARGLLAQSELDALQREAAQPAREAGWTPGGVVGAYRIVSRLGQGGMGQVFVAEHQETGARHAMKSLPSADTVLRLRFRREAEAMARVDRHPNVVRIHGAGEAHGREYLVMDLAPGGDLMGRLTHGPLPADEVVRIGVALASGLAHVHARGLLHRDLKPHNVLFGEQGEPLLVDFGLVRDVDARTLTATGEVLGTPAYMAPEQVTSDRGALGPPTDVYGLGALLYHALTGHPPFEEATALATMTAVLTTPPRPARSRVPGVPAALDAALARALAKAPAERFPDAPAFAAALEAAVAPPRARGRAPLALALFALFALLAAVVAATRSTPEEGVATYAAAPTSASAPVAPPASATTAAQGAALLPIEERILARDALPSRPAQVRAPATLAIDQAGAWNRISAMIVERTDADTGVSWAELNELVESLDPADDDSPPSPPDPAAAAQLLTLVASRDTGVAGGEALRALSRRARRGRGVALHLGRARACLARGAQLGNPGCRLELGLAAWRGHLGLAPRDPDAARLLEQALVGPGHVVTGALAETAVLGLLEVLRDLEQGPDPAAPALRRRVARCASTPSLSPALRSLATAIVELPPLTTPRARRLAAKAAGAAVGELEERAPVIAFLAQLARAGCPEARAELEAASRLTGAQAWLADVELARLALGSSDEGDATGAAQQLHNLGEGADSVAHTARLALLDAGLGGEAVWAKVEDSARKGWLEAQRRMIEAGRWSADGPPELAAATPEPPAFALPAFALQSAIVLELARDDPFQDAPPPAGREAPPGLDGGPAGWTDLVTALETAPGEVTAGAARAVLDRLDGGPGPLAARERAAAQLLRACCERGDASLAGFAHQAMAARRRAGRGVPLHLGRARSSLAAGVAVDDAGCALDLAIALWRGDLGLPGRDPRALELLPRAIDRIDDLEQRAHGLIVLAEAAREVDGVRPAVTSRLRLIEGAPSRALIDVLLATPTTDSERLRLVMALLNVRETGDEARAVELAASLARSSRPAFEALEGVALAPMENGRLAEAELAGLVLDEGRASEAFDAARARERLRELARTPGVVGHHAGLVLLRAARGREEQDPREVRDALHLVEASARVGWPPAQRAMIEAGRWGADGPRDEASTIAWARAPVEAMVRALLQRGDDPRSRVPELPRSLRVPASCEGTLEQVRRSLRGGVDPGGEARALELGLQLAATDPALYPEAPAAAAALLALATRGADEASARDGWFALTGCFGTGYGVPQAPGDVLGCLARGASLGDARALLLLGEAYVRGLHGLGRDPAMGVMHLLVAFDAAPPQGEERVRAALALIEAPPMSEGLQARLARVHAAIREATGQGRRRLLLAAARAGTLLPEELAAEARLAVISLAAAPTSTAEERRLQSEALAHLAPFEPDALRRLEAIAARGDAFARQDHLDEGPALAPADGPGAKEDLEGAYALAELALVRKGWPHPEVALDLLRRIARLEPSAAGEVVHRARVLLCEQLADRPPSDPGRRWAFASVELSARNGWPDAQRIMLGATSGAWPAASPRGER